MTARLQSETIIPKDEPVVVLVREFDAPRELVWRACTEARHLAHWWGPRRMVNQICEMDARPGGRRRVEQRDAGDGAVYRFWGEVLEAEAPRRLVHTQHFLAYPPLLVTIQFDDIGGGRTRLTGETRLGSLEGRDGLLQSGMTQGAGESYDRLSELLTDLKRTAP